MTELQLFGINVIQGNSEVLLSQPPTPALLWNIYMLNIFMTGMAQFLDFDMDSDEDFEESVQQGTF